MTELLTIVCTTVLTVALTELFRGFLRTWRSRKK